MHLARFLVDLAQAIEEDSELVKSSDEFKLDVKIYHIKVKKLKLERRLNEEKCFTRIHKEEAKKKVQNDK